MVGVSQTLIARRIQQGLDLLRKRLGARGVTASAAALPMLLQRPDVQAFEIVERISKIIFAHFFGSSCRDVEHGHHRTAMGASEAPYPQGTCRR